MKALSLFLLALGLALPASATVSIEFQLGGIEVPSGSLGVLVVDADRNNSFTSPSSPEAEGSQLTHSAQIGGDVIIGLFTPSGISGWGPTQKGFATQIVSLDYAGLGLQEGDKLALHIFPQRTENQAIRPGEPHLTYRTDEIGQRTSNSTMGFALPPDGGAHLLAVIGAAQGGQADLASLDMRNLPYAAGSGSFDRALSSTARHTYFFEVGGAGFLSLDGIGGEGLLVELFGPTGQSVYSGGGAEFGLYQTMPLGLYTLVLTRQAGGSGELSYEMDFANSDVRFVLPDLAVGPTLTSLRGNNLLNGAPGQATALTSVKANPVTAFATIANRGRLPDTIALAASPGSALCGIAYFQGSANVTAGLLAGTFRTASLAEGDDPVAVRVQFSPNKKKLTKKSGRKSKILKKSFSTLVRANSTQGPLATDAASIQVQTR